MNANAPDQSAGPQPQAAPEPVLRIPIIEETATITRERVETGRVRLTKTVTEHTETVPLDLRQDEVRVERVAVNQFLPDDAPAPATRYEGDVMIVPVLREVLVKRLLLVEELHISRHQIVTTEPQQVVLRHETVDIERLPPGNGPNQPGAPAVSAV
ncbi:MAG: YsnF/AvaK domain-containing protein [Janthinobacterium lividum]